jgi:hypothetical protein
LETNTRVEKQLEAHEISLAAWDNPSPIVAGESFTVKVGAKCSAGCRLGGRSFEIRDHTGASVASGYLGESPWEGTAGLCWTFVALRAPSESGVFRWTVAFAAPDLPAPHGAAASTFSFAVVPRPEHLISVRVVEKGSQSPIEGAHVRVGPYRASTDSNGLATFEVAAGEHRVTVGKPGYDAETTNVDICRDLRVQVEATPLAEENPDAYWQG